MSDAKLNPRILRQLRHNSQDDESVFEFLKELILMEAQNRSGWWWREPYRNKVEEYATRWRGPHED